MSIKDSVVTHANEAVAPVAAMITGEKIVFLMGMSFIIGSLFTILILILLDFMRLRREKSEK